MNKKVIVIWAGPWWLSAAMILSSKWYDVVVLEKSNVPWGRNSQICSENWFKFDVWPTFLMMKHILEETFEDAWKKVSDYLEFIRLDPMYSLYLNSKKIDIYEEDKKMKEEITKIFPWNEDWFDRFTLKEKARFSKLYRCLTKPYLKISDFLHRYFLEALPFFSLQNSMYDELWKYFNNDDLKICFTFQSKYLGMSPWDCPAAFMMIPYVEHAFWIYHVKWWLSQISTAMTKVCQEFWAKIRYWSEVKQVLIEDKAAKWVLLSDWEIMNADHIIMNSDFAYSMMNLFWDKWDKKYSKNRIEKKKYSCSTFMLYLWLDKIYDSIWHHSIFFSNDYKKYINSVFSDNNLSDDISIYIRNASINDETLAPSWKSSLYILVPVQNLKLKQEWLNDKKPFRDLIINKLKTIPWFADIEEHIEFEKIITPNEWSSDFNVWFGATFNLAHTLDQMLYFRPHNRLEWYENLYLVWWWTHPGSGLPTIYESARIASRLILEQ